MSFFSDLFEGNFSNLGTDVTHAPESLANNPTELEETLGGVAALATGGLALGGLGAPGLACAVPIDRLRTAPPASTAMPAARATVAMPMLIMRCP